MPIRPVLFGASIALAVAANAGAQDMTYKTGLKGAAADAVGKYIASTQISCTRAGKGEQKCPLHSVAVGAKILYGKMPGEVADYAVAFVNYEPDSSGNATNQMAIVFKSAPGAAFAPIGRADDTVGGDPRELRFERGVITYTGTVVGPSDPRCCPTSKATFELRVAADGVKFVDLRDSTAAVTVGSVTRSKAADFLIREQLTEACAGKGGKIDPTAVIERDLTGDGKADLIISHDGITCTGGGRSSACGAQVCSVRIYVRDGALLKVAVDDFLGTMVTVGDGNMPAIQWRAHGGARRAVTWNGRAFR